MSTLKNIIKEMVDQELAEMARISTNIKIGDTAKIESAKKLYGGTWIGDMIKFVEEAGEAGIPQPELAKKLGKSGQQAINPKVRDFLDSNVFTKGELSIAKKEKAPSSGVKGRPTSEKVSMAKEVDQKLQADNDYVASEEETAVLGPEYIEKLRMRVMGTLRRGRPIAPSKSADGMVAAPKDVENMGDVNMDGIFDDEDLEDEEEVMESISINESFLKMQKIAGLIK
jgi:hypothetical protein